MLNWHGLYICVYLCVFVNLCRTEPSALSSLFQSWQRLIMLTLGYTKHFCARLINSAPLLQQPEEQQRFPHENPRITSAAEALLRGCKWVEGLFWNCHLNWGFGHTGTPLIAMNASGPLQGQETLLNRVGKQKIEKTDVVLSSSCLNLIIWFLTSSVYLMKSVTIVWDTEIHAHASNFLNTVIVLYYWDMLGLATQGKNYNSELKKLYQVLGHTTFC